MTGLAWPLAAVIGALLVVTLIRKRMGLSSDPLPWITRAADAYKAWLNDLNRESFNGVITQLLWAYGSIVFTNVAATLMLDEGPKSESHHGWGFQIITALLIGWGVKTAAGVVESRQKQQSNVPFLEAKERGKVAGAAVAMAIAKEHAAVQRRPPQERPPASVEDERGPEP